MLALDPGVLIGTSLPGGTLIGHLGIPAPTVGPEVIGLCEEDWLAVPIGRRAGVDC